MDLETRRPLYLLRTFILNLMPVGNGMTKVPCDDDEQIFREAFTSQPVVDAPMDFELWSFRLQSTAEPNTDH